MGAIFSSAKTTPVPNTLQTLGFHSTARQAAQVLGTHIRGKVFVVTGAYSGIGADTAKALLAEGGIVVLGGRNALLQSSFAEELRNTYDASQVDGDCLLDLADLESVKHFAAYVAKKYKSVVLINNAGVMAAPLSHTKQGFESQMGVNVIGHFLLSKLLIDQTSRQVWVSSIGHKLVSSDGFATSGSCARRLSLLAPLMRWLLCSLSLEVLTSTLTESET